MVEGGLLLADLSFWEQSLQQEFNGQGANDAAGIQLTFLDDSAEAIGSVTSPIIGFSGGWENFSSVYSIPAGTSAITYAMQFWRNTGADLDAFIDDNSLIISEPAIVTPEPATILLTTAPSHPRPCLVIGASSRRTRPSSQAAPSTCTGPIMVVVKTNPGYSTDPGHPGTGTVVATYCHP